MYPSSLLLSSFNNRQQHGNLPRSLNTTAQADAGALSTNYTKPREYDNQSTELLQFGSGRHDEMFQ